MRISDLPDSIKRVSEILLSGMEPYQVDKSFGNNGATIQFYFNLQDILSTYPATKRLFLSLHQVKCNNQC